MGKIKYAKGGMTEHGLRVNDTIKSGGHIGKTTIRVHNSNNGDFRVDLDKGTRTKLEWDKQDRKYKEKMAKGGSLEKLTEKDFIRKKKFKVGNIRIELEKKNNPIYYRATYINLIENEKIGSYGSPSIDDVIYDIRTSKFAKGGVTEHGLKTGDTITDDMFWDNEAIVKDADGYVHYVNLDKGLRDGEKITNRKTGMVHFVLNEMSSGFIINHSSATTYKRADAIRNEMLEILKAQGDSKYSLDKAIKLVKEANYNLLYEKDGLMAKGGKTKKGKEPMVVRGFFDDEPYEYEQGGEIGKELMGGQPNSEPKPSGAILLQVIGKGKEIIVTEDGGATKERYVKSNNYSGYTLRFKGNQYEFVSSFGQGGTMGGWCYSIGGL